MPGSRTRRRSWSWSATARNGARLERLVAGLGLDDAVRLTGAVPRTGVVAELQRADVFALPVRTRLAGLNPEGLGLAALEAAACGLPVVVGRSGGAPETVRDGRTGFVVDPHDHAALADRLVDAAGRSGTQPGDGCGGAAVRPRPVRRRPGPRGPSARPSTS